MALTFDRNVINPVASQTINSAATYTSAEVDLGDDALVERVWGYLEVAGFAANPADTGTFEVRVLPVHTTSGDTHPDQAYTYSFATPDDQAYRFAFALAGLPRFFKVSVKNNTNQNSDASGVNLRFEYVKVTA